VLCWEVVGVMENAGSAVLTEVDVTEVEVLK